ncbi:hypothetical protein NC651_022209 [Populus alba x Populus x berolinensis]|nr:hypothetical protein NC651_022209 [Populus alba x Populus x berolinensis]
MGKNVLVLCFIMLLFLGGVTSVPTATSPAEIVCGFFSNVVSALMKWLWYLKATATSAPFVLSCLFAAVLGLSNFERGYTVETV